MVAVNILQAIAALYVLGVGLIALNRMSHSTAHTIRAAYLTLTAGALALLASAVGATPTSKLECAFAIGVALYLAADRRKHRRART